jgi:hypothetical protein
MAGSLRLRAVKSVHAAKAPRFLRAAVIPTRCSNFFLRRSLRLSEGKLRTDREEARAEGIWQIENAGDV